MATVWYTYISGIWHVEYIMPDFPDSGYLSSSLETREADPVTPAQKYRIRIQPFYHLNENT